MKTLYFSAAVLGLALLMPSCSQYGALETYNQNSIGMVQEVKIGVVQSVKPVIINADDNNAGMAIGAVAGGLSGAALGGGTARNFTGAGGVIGGALIGSQVDKAINQKEGLRINVRLDDGKIMSVTQPKSKNVQIYVGQHVQIYVGYKGSFVEPM